MLGGGLKSQKIIFDQFSLHFRHVWKSLIISFLTKKCCAPPMLFFFLGGGGLKSSKIIFDQFSRHFRQFWTTLIFFIFDKKFLYGFWFWQRLTQSNSPICRIGNPVGLNYLARTLNGQEMSSIWTFCPYRVRAHKLQSLGAQTAFSHNICRQRLVQIGLLF